MTLFSQAGSLNYASHTQPPGSGSEKKTSDTCGPKCLESFERFNHVGLWAKTFSALLIGTGDWYSTRCKLTWKLKGTKYNRLYFQLQASTLPTKGTEFGLLPTPKTMMPNESNPNIVNGRIIRESGQDYGMNLQVMASCGLLPTPTTMDMLPPKTDKAWEKEMTETRPGRTMPSNLRDVPFRTGLLPTPTLQDARIGPNNIGGSQHRAERGSVALADIALGLLPTPKVGGKEGYETMAKRQGHDKAISHLEAFVEYQTGTPSQQLNPQFVLEMMGFPPNWTELPFLNGETNQSRPPETQSCPK